MRILYIDSSEELSPNGVDVLVVSDRDSFNVLSEIVTNSESTQDLIIDCRRASKRILFCLLILIESLNRGVALFASEPVPASILSRFDTKRKSVHGMLEKPVEIHRLRNIGAETRLKLETIWS
jgi:hypothetical protein